MSCLYHNVPGRLRIKLPSIKHNHHRARKIEGRVMALYGVQDVSLNPTTGSLKIMYDPDEIASDEIIQALSKAGYLDKAMTTSENNHAHRGATWAAQTIGKVAMNVALENSGLGLLAALI
jgi:cation transport ATPase